MEAKEIKRIELDEWEIILRLNLQFKSIKL